jgi:hypothetical protein
MGRHRPVFHAFAGAILKKASLLAGDAMFG